MGEVQLLALGDAAWTVQFGTLIDEATHARVMGFVAKLHVAMQADAPGWSLVRDVVPSFRSVSVLFDPLHEKAPGLGKVLMELAADVQSQRLAGRNWLLPACFDSEFALDLGDVAKRHEMQPKDVISALCDATFRVYVLGFMPGFPYMGGLPQKLETPRLANPRKVVPPKSIAIAGQMCAVYPDSSPGGWNLLGRCPIPFFDVRADPPALLAPGDTVNWYEIDRVSCLEMEARLASGELLTEKFLQTSEGLQ